MEETGNRGESSSNEEIRSRIEHLPQPQLVDFLCKLASKNPSIAEEIKTITTVPESDHFLWRKLYIGDIPLGVTSEKLHSDFQMHGEIEEAVVCGKYGFVTYTTPEAAKKAIDYNTLYPAIAQGKNMIVKYADSQSRRGYVQPENGHVNSHAPVGYRYPQTAAVSYAPRLVFSAYSPYGTYGHVSAMTDRFGNQYYYDYDYSNQ